MRIRARYLWPSVVLALGAALVLVLALPSSAANRDKGGKHPGKHGAMQAASARGAMHVRWDIVSLVGGNPPGPLNPGGSASASAPNGGDPGTPPGNGTVAPPARQHRGPHAATRRRPGRTPPGASD